MRERAEHLNRAAERWERGAEGERRTAAVLASLPAGEWTVLHDLAWPGRPRANLDHVMVGPPGVFVIDSKNWSGSLTLQHGVLRQNGRRRDAAVVAIGDAAVAVRQVLPAVPQTPVYGVLCFVDGGDIAGAVGGALVCSTDNLAELVVTRPAVLDGGARDVIVGRLAAGRRRAEPPAIGRLTLADRLVLARPISTKAIGTASSRRGPSKAGAASGLAKAVGVALALGALFVVAARTDVVDQVSQLYVNWVADEVGSDQPTQSPPEQPKKQPQPGQDR